MSIDDQSTGRPKRRFEDLKYFRMPTCGETQTDRNLRQKYGIGIDEFLSLIPDVCPICLQPFIMEPTRNSKYPVIDHCHETHVVRGIICHDCNLHMPRSTYLVRIVQYLATPPINRRMPERSIQYHRNRREKKVLDRLQSKEKGV